MFLVETVFIVVGQVVKVDAANAILSYQLFGKVDEYYIFTRAITPTEVETLFQLIGTTTLTGDANNDNQVTGADIIAVQQHFATIYPSDPDCDGLGLGDADDDCLVTGADLIAVQQNFARVLAAPVPEPAMVALWSVLSLVTMGRR